MTCPPTFSATTNMRRGTSSASVKFQTSFCKATQARNSLSPSQRRITIASELTIASPAVWLAAIGIQVHPSMRFRDCRAFAESLFHPLEASTKFAIGFSQSRFRINREITCDVNQHEKKISNLFFQTLLANLPEPSAVRNQLRHALPGVDREREIPASAARSSASLLGKLSRTILPCSANRSRPAPRANSTCALPATTALLKRSLTGLT